MDTSVIAKWFIKEEKSHKALKILNDYQQQKIQIYVPEIITIELANALYFGGQLKFPLMKQAINNFYALETVLISLTENLINKAVEIMCRFKIAVYDALFIVIAKQEKCFLATADTKHHRKEIYSKIKYL